MDELAQKIYESFPGKVVRKDLTKRIKEGANVPVYVLEYLLGMYCSSTNEDEINEGIKNVKQILAENYVRSDEAQKIISKIRERGSYTVIDRITVKLNIKEDEYQAEFSNLGIKEVTVSSDDVEKYDRLVCGGIWCIVQMDYFYDENDRTKSPFLIKRLTPIQMPSIDFNVVKDLLEQKYGMKYLDFDEDTESHSFANDNFIVEIWSKEGYPRLAQFHLQNMHVNYR